MALPTAPTIATLLTEAFTRAGIPSPTPAQLTRAEDEWFEDVKRDLADRKDWHALAETMVLIPVANIGVYPLPSPLFRVHDIWFYRGDETGTAQAGASGSITLAAGATSNAADVQGRKLYLTGGTGGGQSNRTTSYNTTTKEATVACTWTTTPDNTTTYMIANVERKLSGPLFDLRKAGLSPAEPLGWELWEDQVHLRPIPDASTYALELRGFVDISLVDETDARFTRMLREWRQALVLGVMVKIFEDHDDENATAYEVKYERAVTRIMIADSRKRRRAFGVTIHGPGGLPRSRTGAVGGPALWR